MKAKESSEDYGNKSRMIWGLVKLIMNMKNKEEKE